MKDKSWSPLDIAKWHEKTFPDTTLEGQKAKLEEEKKEWLESHEIDELADIYIVACGLLRWPAPDAKWAFWYIEEAMLDNAIFASALLKSVDNKMEINYNRKWKATKDGAYHHV